MEALEAKIDALGRSLETARRQRLDAQRQQEKCDREIVSLECTALEDNRHTNNLNNLVTNLQNQLEGYKAQAEEADCIAARNLHMFRCKQQEVEEMSERARLNEEKLARIRSNRHQTTL